MRLKGGRNIEVIPVRKPTRVVNVCRFRHEGKCREIVTGVESRSDAIRLVGRVRDMERRYGWEPVVRQLVKFRELRYFVEYIELAELASRCEREETARAA